MNWTIKDLSYGGTYVLRCHTKLGQYLVPDLGGQLLPELWHVYQQETTGQEKLKETFKQYPLLHGLLKPQVSSAFILPVAGLGFDPSPTTISEPVLSAQTSNCSLAAALKVSPAAMSTFNVTTSHCNVVTHPVVLEQEAKRNFICRWKWLHYST